MKWHFGGIDLHSKNFTLFLLLFFFVFNFSNADEYDSSSFRIMDPVIVPSGFATSSGFQLWSTISEIAQGLSSSTSFMVGGGFLNLPFVSTPVVISTAGDGQVSLSWTASQGFLGLNPSSYTVGQSTTNGGPYTLTNVGNVLSSVRTSLANSTTYYFIVAVNDSFGNTIATSSQISSTPVAPVVNNNSNSGGGGGGGGGGVTGVTSVIFSGRAYPKSTVTLLKDAQVAATTIAGADANFQMSVSNFSPGNYIFSIYSEDTKGLRSSLLSFPVSVTAGASTNVSGIFITPTIDVDKTEVKKGDNIAIFGQSTPKSEIVIQVNSDETFFDKKISDENGAYLFNFDTSVLELGQHSTKSKTSLNGEISSFSKVVGFTVGAKNVLNKVKTDVTKSDVNDDHKVNLVDFSIVSYWYKRPNPPATVDLNRDGKIDLKDFSIMAYHWTG